MKKLVLLLVVLFLGFYLLTQPDSLGDLTQTAIGETADFLGRLFGAVIDFLQSVTS